WSPVASSGLGDADERDHDLFERDAAMAHGFLAFRHEAGAVRCNEREVGLWEADLGPLDGVRVQGRGVVAELLVAEDVRPLAALLGGCAHIGLAETAPESVAVVRRDEHGEASYVKGVDQLEQLSR